LPHRTFGDGSGGAAEEAPRDKRPASDDGATTVVPTAPVTYAAGEPPNPTKPVPLAHADPDTPNTPPAPTRARSRRGPLLLVLVLILALLAGVGGWYYGVGRFDDTPDLEGMALKRATRQAVAAGFTLDVATKTYSETAPKGTVISTAPEPGDRILPDSTIDATVSKGKERYAVPELAGKTEEEARNV